MPEGNDGDQSTKPGPCGTARGRWRAAALSVGSAAAIALAVLSQAHAQPVGQRLSQYGHTVWHVQDGQFSSPNAITQSRDGYLWLATDAGLTRFDGLRFTTRSGGPDASTAGVGVSAALGTRDGSLWVAVGLKVVQWKQGRSTIYTVPGKVMQFVEDDAGTVWFVQSRTNGRGGPLCRIASGKLDCFGAPELPFPYASTVAIAQGGGLWIGGSMGLCLWSQGQPATCQHQEALKSMAGLMGVNAIVPRPNGTLWVGIGKAGRDLGLGQIADGTWKPLDAAGLDGSSLSVSSLLEDRNGALWIGTTDRGLYRIQGGRAEHFGRAEGLSSDTIAVGGLFQDREGSVWVLTSAGLDAFRPLAVSVFSVQEGLPADAVGSVLADSQGTVWFGNRTLSTLAADEPAPAPRAELFRDRHVTSLLEDHAGRLWIGLDNTLNVFDKGVLKPIPAANGGDLGVIERIVEDSRHDIWVTLAGEPPKLLRIREGGRVERVDGTGPVPANLNLLAIAADPKGGVLLGRRNGTIVSLREAEYVAYEADAISSAAITGLHADTEGTILATTFKGLLVQRGTTRRLLDSAHGLPCERLRAVARDRRADVWLLGSCGILWIRAGELERWLAQPAGKAAVRQFDVTDGVRPGYPSFMPMISVAPDGRVWFANDKIAQVIDPAAVETPHPAPAVLVEQVTADRQVFDATGPLRLPPRTRDLELRYTALSFIAPQRIRFRYRLEGRDQTWTDADTRRQAFYTDLPPGHYRFRVMACSAEGVWNETGATQEFEIPPLFYQTAWFIALCTFAALGTLYGLYLLRLQQVAARVRERIAAKNAERERIARDLHDTLLQSTEGLILRFQAASSRLPAGDPVRAALEDALDRADEVVAEGRDRVQDLRTSDNAFGDLPRALAEVGQELARASATEFHSTVEGQARALKPMVLDEIYRIGREALLNAHRHAAARRIEVQIIHGDDEFQLRIRDDGIGIDPHVAAGQPRPGHWGLQGMRERAQKIGAQCEIWSRPGAGTEIEVRIAAAQAYEAQRPRSRWLAAFRLASG